MADATISALPSLGSALLATTGVPVVRSSSGVTERATLGEIADFALKDRTSFLAEGTGAVARTTQAKLREFVSPEDFGAVGDGVTNDLAAFQAALDAGHSLWLDTKTYFFGGTLRYKFACQVIRGGGPRSVRGTRLLFDDAVTERIVADSDAAGVTLFDCGLFNVLVTSASAYVDGTALTLNKAQAFHGEDLTINNIKRCVDAFGSRVTTWFNTIFTAKRAGGWCMRLRGNLANFGGVAYIERAQWDCAETGAGPDGLGQEADGLVLEGAVATVTAYSLQVVRARRALACVAGSEGSGLTANPYFVYLYDFQSDATGQCGIHIAAGNDIAVDRGWIQGGERPYQTSPERGAGIFVASSVKKFVYCGYQGGHVYAGMDIAGEQITLSDLSCGRNSSTTSNTYDNVIIRAAAADVDIKGGRIGVTENGSGLARYNITAESGATRIRVIGTNLTGAVTGAINDLTDGEMQVLAAPGTTERVSARGTSILELGNQGQAMLRVGNATALTVGNRLRVAGAANGFAPQILAEGDSDANVDINLLPKGTGRVVLGTSTLASSPGAFSATRYLAVKDQATGTVLYVPCSAGTW